MSRTRRHINRKRTRLIEKVEKLLNGTYAIVRVPKDAQIPGNLDFDPEAVYINRNTLLELLKEPEDIWIQLEDSDIIQEDL